jgi:ankyrin repeat protein
MQTFNKSNKPNNIKHGPPLVRAARNGDYVELEGYLRAGMSDPNLPDALGKCPLVYACEGGHQACAGLLLRAGANPNHRGEVRATRHTAGVCYQRTPWSSKSLPPKPPTNMSCATDTILPGPK